MTERPSSKPPRPDVSDVFKPIQEGEGKAPAGFAEGVIVGLIVAVSVAFPLIALHLVY